jgi:two-component system response regulator YesN
MIRVLLVDDDRLARSGMRSLLPWEKYGMKVVGEAANGQKALEFLESNEVDLLFIDLQMPVMSGMELIDVLNRDHPDLCFVVFSVQEDFVLVRQAFRKGALDYISKMKLDTEDYDQLFNSISIATSKNTGVFSGTKQPSWIPKLSEKSWLFDGLLYEKLISMIRRSPEVINWVERALLRIAVIVEQETGFIFNPHPVTSTANALEQIENFRTSLYRTAKKGPWDCAFKIALRAVLYIQEHYDKRVREEDVAAFVNLSRSYFSTHIKKITDFTFMELLSRERVRRSLLLLNEGQLSVVDIALRVGYEDPHHFTHLFSKIMGCNPHTWKNTATD